MADSTTRVELPAYLGLAAEACGEAVGRHIETAQPDLRFQRQVLFSVAALQNAAARSELENADVRLVRSAASDAAAVCRTERPDDAMQRVVARLEEVVAVCDAVLGERGEAAGEGWQRFVFADADVSVLHERRGWRVRGDAGETADRFLDAAIAELVPLGNHRVGELTVQILDWFALAGA